MQSNYKVFASGRITRMFAFAAISAALLFVFQGNYFSITAQTINSGRKLTSISVSPANLSLAVKATEQFTATAKFSDGSTRNLTSSAKWSSSKPATATVESAGQTVPGLATAVASGSTTITASVNGFSGSATLTVTTTVSKLTSITLTPANPSLAQGATQQFTAMGNFSNGTTQNLTTTATWTSSSSGVVSVESAGQAKPGLATALSAGAATIMATVSGITGKSAVTVGNPTLSQVFVSPATNTSNVGTTEQFRASAYFADGTAQDVTDSATWTSSNTKIATVENAGGANPGLALAVTNGSTLIKATFEGMSATSPLNVTTGVNTQMIPLMDMTSASQNYLGFEGGLYENSSDNVPSDHNSAGLTIAGTIQPLNATGSPSATGKVVLVSIGMSNAADEFGMFATDAAASSSVNHTTLVIANGAKGGITACYWTAPQGPPPCSAKEQNQFDRVLSDVLTPLGVTEDQVQALWIKEANGGPGIIGCGSNGSLPCNSLCDASVKGCVNTATTTEALRYEQQLGEILRAAKSRWPNLKVAFLTSRIYAGYAQVDLNPEPFAYEYGFSVKWLIEAQINQVRTGATDPTAGNLEYSNNTSPWVAWGPYVWADGENPRSDGLIWCDGQATAPCNGEVDYRMDGTHPNGTGQQKVAEGLNTPKDAQNLLNFFLTSPYTKAWFAAAK